MKALISNIFHNSATPVIVCEYEKPYRIVFTNISAKILTNPLTSADTFFGQEDTAGLSEVLRFQREDQYLGLMEALSLTGTVAGYKADISTYLGETIAVSITANVAEIDKDRYIVFYLYAENDRNPYTGDVGAMLDIAFHVANQSANVDEAIHNVMAYAGNSVKVSRVYIFEEITKELTSNTYEWCAPGVIPAIQDLKELKKEDYNYDIIIGGGMYITDDIRNLPENDRAILESQGIKSLAILPLFHAGEALGYIGFDDCDRYRKWTDKEINLLNNMASLVVSLLSRRNSERRLSRSKDVLKTISDNMESLIYVNDIDTHEIIFLNNTLAKALGQDTESLLGDKCYAHLQLGMDAPCPFCPMPKMLKEDYLGKDAWYTWEFQNTITGKWYLVKDSFIKWIDGRDVHIETATEITHQKAYEEQLKYYASVDSLTGVYNREWGYKLMDEMLRLPGTPENETSLVFIDLDNLKGINDTYGHEAGDRFICGVISVLQANKRKSDIICRWGGDEFVLLLNCGTEAARRVMANMEKKVGEYSRQSGEPFSQSFSYGITEFQKGSDSDISDIIDRADQAMYTHKGERLGK